MAGLTGLVGTFLKSFQAFICVDGFDSGKFNTLS